MTRDEAVAWLRAAGLDAEVRDWAMGHTIAVPLGAPEMRAGIVVHPSVAYLCLEPSGKWSLRELGARGESWIASFETLEDAVCGARNHARGWSS